MTDRDMSRTPVDETRAHSPAAQPCAGCALQNRRTFVQDAVASVAALIGLSLVNVTPALAQVSAWRPGEAGAADGTRYPMPAADGVTIDAENDVIIARSAGFVYAFALSCPHQNTALRWLQKDNRFQCPKHKSRYRPDGAFIEGRATRNMDRLPIKRDAEFIVVDTATAFRSDDQAAEWAAAFVKV